jgi:CRISPR-associated protein Cas1
MPRAGDRISYLFLDMVRVEQVSTGIFASWSDGQSLQVPYGSLGCLMLGPGTSITAPAASSLFRAGCTVLYTDAEGLAAYSVATPLSARADWVQAQTRVWSDPTERMLAARRLYLARFPELDLPDGVSIDVLRGIEGRLVRNAYLELSRKHGLSNWHRETDKEKQIDAVNPLINIGNSYLYAIALAAVSAIGCTPALGVIHQGTTSSLLFDLADHFKASIILPAAFSSGSKGEDIAEFRGSIRRALKRQNAIEAMFELLDLLFGHARQSAKQDLLLSETGFVQGGINHGDKVSE